MRQGRGLGGVYLRGGTWWIRYSQRGRKIRESSESKRHAVAVKLLKKRLGELGQGRLVGPDVEKTTLSDLRTMLFDDYALNGRKSLDRAKSSVSHVVEFFGEEARGVDITADRIVAYTNHRRERAAFPATIRNELAALKRMFSLGVRAGRLAGRPAFPIIDVKNARKGFFERSEFEAVLEHLPPEVQPLAEFLYLTGWRKGEALLLGWANIDLKAGIIRIDDSKNGEAREIPFRALPDLAALIDRQREKTEAVQQAKGIIINHVFHRNGRPIRAFREAWESACEEAGVTRYVHDFRRTAARNLIRAGVPEKVAMLITGHRTRAVFDRYHIVNNSDVAEALAKLAKFHQSTEPESQTNVRKGSFGRTGTVRAQPAVAARAARARKAL